MEGGRLGVADTINVQAAMPSRRYVFGRTKVYPAPTHTLDPEKAPWSAPRGYTTSIPESVAAYKLSISQSKVAVPTHQPLKVKQVKQKQRSNYLSKCWTAIKNHFRAVKQDMLPQQTEQDPNGDVRIPPLVSCICCLPRH